MNRFLSRAAKQTSRVSFAILMAVVALQALEQDAHAGGWDWLTQYFKNPFAQSKSTSRLSTSSAGVGSVLSKVAGLPSTAICSANGHEKLWAQQRLNSDLMQSYISSHHLIAPGVQTRTYVVDTGFDSKQIPNMMPSVQIQIEPGIFGTKSVVNGKETGIPNDPTSPNAESAQPLVGDPMHDAGGHGTMVASAIGGAGGIGTGPHSLLTVMRITASDEPGSAESTSDDFTDYAVMLACAKGSAADSNGLTVINSSWGDRADEDRKLTLEKRNPELVSYLNAHGCLLVMAAGNSSFRNVAPSLLPDGQEDPVLRVGATQNLGGMAKFSSLGVVDAPGENVFLLASSVANPAGQISNSRLCEPGDGKNGSLPQGFTNGTSFASPFTAGIAAEVATILRSAHQAQFEALSPGQKIAVVKRILEASENFGNIDGLRAAIIAERWRGDATLSSSQMAALLTTPADFCSGNPSDYTSQRMQVSACANFSASQSASILEALTNSGLSLGLLDDVSGYISDSIQVAGDAQALHPMIETFVVSYINSLIPGLVSTTQASEQTDVMNNIALIRLFVDASLADFILPEHLRATQGSSDALLFSVLTSYSVTDYLHRGPGRGGEQVLDSLVNNLQLMKQLQGDAEVKSLVNQTITYFLSQIDPADKAMTNARYFSSAIQILDSLQSNPAFGFMKSTLDALDVQVFSSLDKTPAYFGTKLEDVVTITEIYPNRIYAYNFIDRMSSATSGFYEDGHPENHSSVMIEYLLDHADSTRAQFVLAVGAQLKSNPAWKLNKFDLTQSLQPLLMAVLERSSPAELSSYLSQMDFSNEVYEQAASSAISFELKNITAYLKANEKLKHKNPLSDENQLDIQRLELYFADSKLITALAADAFSNARIDAADVSLEMANPGAAKLLPADFLAALKSFEGN